MRNKRASAGRRWSVDLWRNGVVTIRPITEKKYKGASLQMCVADSKGEAEGLRTFACKLAYNGKQFILPEFAGTVEAAKEASEMFVKLRDRRRAKKTAPTEIRRFDKTRLKAQSSTSGSRNSTGSFPGLAMTSSKRKTRVAPERTADESESAQ